MEKTRVPKGESYWFIDTNGELWQAYDMYERIDNTRFAIGNYFEKKYQAESMARKLRAVLKGAEVIEKSI